MKYYESQQWINEHIMHVCLYIICMHVCIWMYVHACMYVALIPFWSWDWHFTSSTIVPRYCLESRESIYFSSENNGRLQKILLGVAVCCAGCTMHKGPPESHRPQDATGAPRQRAESSIYFSSENMVVKAFSFEAGHYFLPADMAHL